MTTATVTEPLTRAQFAEFCCEVWNSHEPKAWASSDEAMWRGLFEFEMCRRFNDGHSYCQSGLEIGPSGRRWFYATTSGTVLSVQQKVLYQGQELPATEYEVSIPAHRAEGTHAGFLQGVLEGSTYFSWGELYYSKEGTPAYTEARRRGMAIASDPEEIARIEAQAKARRAHQMQSAILTDEDFDYDDPDSYDEDFDYVDEEE